jgi:competence protein ComEC
MAVAQAHLRLDDRWPAARHGEDIEATGTVASLVERVDGGAGRATLRFEFSPEDDRLPARVRASWYRTEAAVRGGTCWRLRLKMRVPRGTFDPGAFDYEAWLYRRDVGAIATVRDGAPCGLDGGAWILRARQVLVDRLDAWIGASPGLAMSRALTVGDTSGFSDADWNVFRRTGTTHLVAISGFNIAIAAGAAFFLLRWGWAAVPALVRRWPAPKAGRLAAGIVALLYGLLAGWESPAQRAALMVVLVLLATIADRRADPWRFLALVWMALLIADPSQVTSPGLWLSFGAVAAIYAATLARRAPASTVRLAIGLQLMLSVVLAPLSLAFFGGTAWPGLFVNLAAVPAMALLTPLLLGAIVVAFVAPWAGIPAVKLVAAALARIEEGLGWAAQLPDAWIPAAAPAAALALALFGAVLMFAPRGVPLRALGLACCVPLFVVRGAGVRAPFELTVLDVGQGLSAIVETRAHVLVFDAGPAFEEGFDAGAAVVVPALLARGHRQVDRLLLSHADLDHAGGVAGVRRLLIVRDEIGTPSHSPCVDGDRWTWDGVHFEILHPPPDDAGASENDRSCVLRVSAPGFTVLLPADIEVAAEARLLRDHPDRLRADVLVAPHHGSRSSSSDAFVAAVNPSIVVFSAGWRSRFGHPRPEVVARYRAAGAQPRTTGVEGALRVHRGEDGSLHTEAWRREHPGFWTAPPEP